MFSQKALNDMQAQLRHFAGGFCSAHANWSRHHAQDAALLSTRRASCSPSGAKAASHTFWPTIATVFNMKPMFDQFAAKHAAIFRGEEPAPRL